MRTKDNNAVIKSQEQRIDVPLVDLSGGGMKIILSENITLGSKIKGEFLVFPHQKPYFIEGSVVWSKAVSAGNQFEVGIKFEKVSAASFR